MSLRRRRTVVVLVLLVAAVGVGLGLAYRQRRAAEFVPPPEWLTPLPTYPAFFSPTPAPPTPTPTATPSPTVAPPTPTPTATPSPTATPTAPVAELVAEGNLYCRAGPGPYYERVAVLQPGDRARAVGYATFGSEQARYWFVALDDTRLCWVRHHDRYLTFEPGSDPAALPLYPTPPPPEVAFTVRFAGQAECGNQHGWLFDITNYGTRAIESVRITFTQGAGGQSWPTYLTWWRDCSTRSGGPAIQPGRSMLVTVDGVGPGYGQTFTATVRVCARDHLLEPCAEQMFSFRP